MRLLIIVSLLILGGCSSEKAEVVTYLKALEDSNHRLDLISREYQDLVFQVSEQIGTGKSELPVWKTALAEMSGQVREEKMKVQELEVPPRAAGLHNAVLQQYQVLIDTVNETVPMIEMMIQVDEANRRVTEDPGAAVEIAGEMKAVEARREQLAGRIEELMKKGREHEDSARQEQQKLQREFGIAIKTEQ